MHRLALTVGWLTLNWLTLVDLILLLLKETVQRNVRFVAAKVKLTRHGKNI